MADDLVYSVQANFSMPAGSSVSQAQKLVATGAELFGKNMMEGARMHFLAALELEPDNVMALQNMGAVLRSMGHFEASEIVARRSVELDPSNPYPRANLGVAMLATKKHTEALRIMEGITRELPEHAPAWHNLGLTYYMLNRTAEALQAFDKAIKVNTDQGIPSPPALHSDRALALLSLARLKEGLALYDVRWQLLAKNILWSLPVPQWRGEPLGSDHILVHHEQGFGDGLMLSRFLKQLHEQHPAAKISLAVPQELFRLMKLSFGAVVEVLPLDDNSELLNLGRHGFNWHCPIMDLMLYVGPEKTAGIDSTPYLRAPKGEDLPTFVAGRFKIGICWASGKHGPGMEERRRIAPLVEFMKMSEIKNTSLVSLQKGPGLEQIEQLGFQGLIHNADRRLTDFAATAAMILKMDLVVSVDSAVAHLAGALGVPTVMLSPYTRCWRWWGRDSGMPWYRNMTVFYQKQNGSWTEAIQQATRKARLMQMGLR